MASITKLGVWRRTGVRVQHTGRRTHRVHPAKSIVMKRRREARAGIFGRGRENLRDTAHQAMSWNMRTMSSAGRGWRRKAPSISPSSAPALPIVLHARHAAFDTRSAAAAPRAPPYGRGKARRRRTGALAGARHHAAAAAPAPAPPYLHTPLRPRAVETARTAVRRAGGRGAASTAAPTRRGAAAPSSLLSAVISPVFCHPQSFSHSTITRMTFVQSLWHRICDLEKSL